MEARLASILLLAASLFCLGADYRTTNFTVRAPSPQFARQVAELAEEYRRDLALLWLGHELPDWPEPCPITVRIEPHAGGETSFVFTPNRTGRSQPSQWRMIVFGPPERILDSVLPHEVNHTIFATHFGRPLPRWADEGACTTVEHESERKKNHRMLIQFLSSGRGIPFNHMFSMRQYPQDILPLYAQGHSLARYLIGQRGHRHFVDYIDAGMRAEQPGRVPQAWSRVTQQFYGYEDLSELQVSWLEWVKAGSPETDRTDIAARDALPELPEQKSPSEGPVPGIQQGASDRLAATPPADPPLVDPGESGPPLPNTRPPHSLAQQGEIPLRSPPPRAESVAESTVATTPPTRHADSQEADSWYFEQMRGGHAIGQESRKALPAFQPGSVSQRIDIERLIR